MLKLAVTMFLAVGVGALVFPLSVLCERDRRRLAFASLFLCLVVVGLDQMTISSEGTPSPVAPTLPAAADDRSSAVTVTQTSTANSSTAGAEANQNKQTSAATVTAMRGKKSLYVQIRRDGNLYCAADNPALMVAEFDGQFIAVNGITRNWVSNQGLSVYRDRTWLPVVDVKTTDPKYPGFATIQPLIDKSKKLCPTVIRSGSYLDELSRLVSEGESRFIKRGAEFGLASDDEIEAEVEKMAPRVSCSQFRERFTDALTGNREGIALVWLFTGPKQEKFEVPNIQAAIGCSADGMFEGFGATLMETDDGNIRRYARFSAAAVRATDPGFDHSAALQFMTDLTKEALRDARDTERKTGQLRGSAEKQIGSYVIVQRFLNGLVRTGIELRYKD